MQSNYLPAAAQKTTHFKKDRCISIARAHFLPNRKRPHMSNPGMAFSSNQKRQAPQQKIYKNRAQKTSGTPGRDTGSTFSHTNTWTEKCKYQARQGSSTTQ